MDCLAPPYAAVRGEGEEISPAPCATLPQEAPQAIGQAVLDVDGF